MIYSHIWPTMEMKNSIQVPSELTNNVVSPLWQLFHGLQSRFYTTLFPEAVLRMRGDIEDDAAILFVTLLLVVHRHINNGREFVFLLILYSSSPAPDFKEDFFISLQKYAHPQCNLCSPAGNFIFEAHS